MANSDLATEAATLLDSFPERKAGLDPFAQFTSFRPSADKTWSLGQLQWGPSGKGSSFPAFDFGDHLPVTEGLADMLGGDPGSPEVRQCVTLHLAAGLLWLRNPRQGAPGLLAVQK